MALQRDARYPGRWTAASGGHPQGAFKNRTAPGSLDGSYIEQDWANDWDGYFSSLLSAAGLTANGTVDAVGASQYFDALKNILAARAPFQGVAIFSTPGSGTWTVPAGVKKVYVKVIGGGGGGARRTVSPGPGGGGGGGVAEGLVDLLGASSVAYTVGTGGSGATADGNNGIVGSSTNFGAFMSATGGSEGTFTGNNSNSGTGTGGTLNYGIGPGAPAFLGVGSSIVGGAGGGGASPGAQSDTARPSNPGMGGGGRTTSNGAAGAHGAVYIFY